MNQQWQRKVQRLNHGWVEEEERDGSPRHDMEATWTAAAQLDSNGELVFSNQISVRIASKPLCVVHRPTASTH